MRWRCGVKSDRRAVPQGRLQRCVTQVRVLVVLRFWLGELLPA